MIASQRLQVELLLLLLILLASIPSIKAIATDRTNVVLERTLKTEGVSTKGAICDSGLTVTPTSKEGALAWDLGDMFVLHEVTVTLGGKADAAAVQELSAKMGFADSNFFTHYTKMGDTYTTKFTLRPDCFQQGQWGASGSHLRIELRVKSAIKIQCIEAMGVKMGGKNVMMGKPVVGENSDCKSGNFFINDVFEDGHLNYADAPYRLMADFGKIYHPKTLEVDVKGAWEDGEIKLMPNYWRGNVVKSCKEKKPGRYVCPLKGDPARYLQLEGQLNLPKIREIRVNI